MFQNNLSYQSETSSKFNEESRIKIDSFLAAFQNLGWDSSKELNQQEILYFLNGRTKDGQFDETLANKIFTVLDVDDSNTITVEEFIKGYLQFESDLKKNNEDFNRKYMQEQQNLNALSKQCSLYKSEKLNAEGLCENAKITVEITDVDIKKTLEGIKSIIIRVIYNDEVKEFRISGNNTQINEKFEFKPKSRRDRFEFIMKGINDRNKEFDIGSKVFALDSVVSQEEYTVQITIPEIEDENKPAAYINAKIILFWSDYELYETKMKKSEQKLRKLKDALNKTLQYLNKIKEVYGDNSNQIDTGSGRQKFKSGGRQNYQNDYGENQEEGEVYMMEDNGINGVNEMTGQYGNVGAMNLIKILGLSCTLLGIMQSVKRPDFPNEVGGLMTFIGCFLAANNNANKAKGIFKFCFIALLVLILFDFIWLVNHITIINIDKYYGGHENFVMFFCVVFCAANIVLKSFLCVFLVKQYNNAKNAANQNGEAISPEV